MQVGYCIKCFKEMKEDENVCECGTRTIVFGKKDTFHQKGELVQCKCGSEAFTRLSHVDMTDKATTTYVCKACDNVIGVDYHRTKEDMMYHGDDD